MLDQVMAFVRAHARVLVLVLAGGVMLVPFTAQSLSSDSELFLSVNAPERGDALQVDLEASAPLLGGCSGEPSIEIRYEDIIQYVSTDTVLTMDGCTVSADIPYSLFASENGAYTLDASFNGEHARSQVEIQKVVNWVYVRSFPNQTAEHTRVDIAFDRAKGQPLTSSIFTSGTLVLDILYEGCRSGASPNLPVITQSGCEQQQRPDSVFRAEIPIEDRASTHVFIPWENLDDSSTQEDQAQEGWYNVTATYHNDEAQNNNAVPMDPTVFREEPPGNWFEVSSS